MFSFDGSARPISAQAHAFPTPSDRLESVQMLRGVAAMLVVYNHAGLYLALWPESVGGASWLAPDDTTARMGAIGVDLFFVISGFVMALTAQRFTGAHGARTFLALRFVRIAPLYYLACLAMLALIINPGTSVGRETVLNSITFIPVFDDGRYSWPLHYLGWTLAFEFVFYVFVAALVATGFSGRPLALLVVVACVPLLGFVVDFDLALWRVATNPIIWEFALGVLAYLMWRRGWLPRLAVPLALGFGASLAAFALVLWLSPDDMARMSRGTIHGDNSVLRAFCWGVPAWLCFCAVVAWARPDRQASGRGGASLRWLTKVLGDASYSIYLSHLGVVMVLQKVVTRVPLPADLMVIGTMILSAIVGVLVYRTVEAPMLRIGQQFVRDHVSRNRPATPQHVRMGNADQRGTLRGSQQR
jgi:peptidoglycan/LPS O-acetylase OafA/YrhL